MRGTQRFRSVGLVSLSYSMALLSVKFTASTAQTGCIFDFFADGDCDVPNNNEECGYDHGDCCRSSCVDGEYACGFFRGFDCLDPDHSDDFPYQRSSYSFDYWGCGNNREGNGNCDYENNSEECGYDGGDCCERSCVDNDYVCGANGGFDCLDPEYSHYFEDDDNDFPYPSSYSFGDDFFCQQDKIGNGYCNPSNNHELCGYDGGDCCSCTCPNVPSISCGGLTGNTCIDPRAPCLDNYIEVGTLTDITMTASLFNVRGFQDEDACMPGGCRPELTRDGEWVDQTSRWACSDNEYQCVLTFSFGEAVNIDYIQVAFYRPDYLWRGVEVSSNGVYIDRFESSAKSTFTAFALHADAVQNLTLRSSSNQFEFEGFSLLEVRFMVENPDT